jgi:hypothetical protein
LPEPYIIKEQRFLFLKGLNVNFCCCILSKAVDMCSIRESRYFWIFWDFQFPIQLNLDWLKNSMTKVAKAFFFIFMSSYAEMRFLGQKRQKINKYGPKIFSLRMVRHGYKKIQ